MKQPFNILWSGIREPFKHKNFTLLFLVLFFVFSALFVLIPVWTVRGNTIAIQLDILTIRDYIVLAFLSLLSALFIAMQIYIARQSKRLSGAGTATAGGLGALFAGVTGTAFCASCLAPLFALFGIGLGGTLFVLEYRWYFVAAITFFMLVAIYLTARRIGSVCASC